MSPIPLTTSVLCDLELNITGTYERADDADWLDDVAIDGLRIGTTDILSGVDTTSPAVQTLLANILAANSELANDMLMDEVGNE